MKTIPLGIALLLALTPSASALPGLWESISEDVHDCRVSLQDCTPDNIAMCLQDDECRMDLGVNVPVPCYHNKGIYLSCKEGPGGPYIPVTPDACTIDVVCSLP